MKEPRSGDAAILADIDRLIEEQRASSLWFLRSDFGPATREERLRALELIERHCDRETFRRAATLRRWLSQTSSDASAAS